MAEIQCALRNDSLRRGSRFVVNARLCAAAHLTFTTTLDVVNAAIHLARGNYFDAALSGASALPALGVAVGMGLGGLRALKYAEDVREQLKVIDSLVESAQASGKAIDKAAEVAEKSKELKKALTELEKAAQLAPNSVVDNVFHATTSPGAAQGVLNGIDPKFLNPNARFGRAFYVAEQPGTTLAELAHHGAQATHGIRFSYNGAAAKVLDLTDPAVAKAWGYTGGPISPTTQAIGAQARAAGFNAIRFKSLRGTGNNLAIMDNFNDILRPQMISPAQ